VWNAAGLAMLALMLALLLAIVVSAIQFVVDLVRWGPRDYPDSPW
jgi:hypothetical protein